MTTTINKPRTSGTTQLYADGQRISLDPPIGSGREGIVHPVSSSPNLAVKLISPQNPDPQETASKLALMVRNPLPLTESRHYRITWPTGLVSKGSKNQATVGYTMPCLDATAYRQIGSYFNPLRRRRLLRRRERGYSYLNLLAVARNLSLAVAHVHRHGALIGDLNSRNVLANDRARVAIIDTDSFQVADPDSGEIHRCLVGTPEYTPPRLQGTEFSAADRTMDDDLFSLAIMLYQLLIQGTHPYAGTSPQAHDNLPNDIATRIAQGKFAHRKAQQEGAGPTLASAIIWEDLPLKRQFNGAFQDHRPRTTAQAWANAISQAAHNLRQCSKNPLHRHFKRWCTWCRYRTATGVEPFPFPERHNLRLRSGKDSKPAAKKTAPKRPRR